MAERPGKTARTINVTIRLSPEERRVWTVAAKLQDRGLSSWLRWLANRETTPPRGAGARSGR
jgi:hypothetical protein